MTGFHSWNPFLQEDDISIDEGPRASFIPDREKMEARRNFRETSRRETADHRRIIPGGDSTISLCRNIVFVLLDRERRGNSSVTSRRLAYEGRSTQGNRSPSTVFESPISTTSPSLYQAKSPTETKMVGSEEMSNEISTRDRLRKVCYPMKVSREIQTFGEHCSALKYQSSFLHHLGGDDEMDVEGNRPTSSRAVSTISVAFSPDAMTMASTHGDHTVKISCCNSGLLLQSLEGHPRTPWTVKYHPTKAEIVASGCLGHQVRIWNWREKTCLQMVRLEFAIISLSFHPTGQVLAVANGTRLHFWGIDCSKDSSSASAGDRRTVLTEMDQRHMLRCVHFPPNGKTIIIGGVNPTTEDTRRRNRGGIGGGGMSFYLRLWDFDLARALNPQSDLVANGISIARRPISNPRTFVPRALLYNDGGFDVSPDGMTLCACAEYWLPDGVDNAMEILHEEEVLYGADGDELISLDGDPSTDDPAASVSETKIAVAAALSRLRGISHVNAGRSARSPSFRDGMEHPFPRTPTLRAAEPPPQALDFVPQTPPNPIPLDRPSQLSPPPPPGRRFAGGLGQRRETVNPRGIEAPVENRGLSTPPPPPTPPAPQAPGGASVRPPHPLSIISRTGTLPDQKGRYVPHVIAVSLDTVPVPEEADPKLPRGKPYGAVAAGYRPRLGQLLEACPLDPSKASAVTCVKYSPSTDFCLIGYGVREPLMEGGGNFHPVTAIYRVRGGMTHVSTMLSGDDDVNIARFHPDSGYGFVYGTKQGRVRLLSPRPWNYYNC